MIAKYLVFRGWWRDGDMWQRLDKKGRVTLLYSTIHALLITLKLEDGVPVPRLLLKLAKRHTYPGSRV